jgi:uncharacterized protein (TIGR03437 family)
VFQFDPQTPDSFYPANSQVTVTAANQPGFKFRRWAGDLTGTYASGFLAMTAPHAVTALMDRVPYIAPTGIQNAAGSGPDAVVAPGSLIAISGQSLASDFFQGPSNPLAQTLGGVTVTIADRYLALVSASPQVVVAQLPSDLPVGDYTLQVHSQGQPDVSGAFTMVRNAPGVFSTAANGLTFVTATHADGTTVTPDSPAQQGETITILGTGFGPFVTPVIDGFFPVDPAPALQDSVDVLVGDQAQVMAPVWVGAASGMTGMVGLQLKIGDPIPAASMVKIQVRLNGRLSNVVQLPTQ